MNGGATRAVTAQALAWLPCWLHLLHSRLFSLERGVVKASAGVTVVGEAILEHDQGLLVILQLL